MDIIADGECTYGLPFCFLEFDPERDCGDCPYYEKIKPNGEKEE